MTLIEIGGFILPIEWFYGIVGLGISFFVLLFLVIILFLRRETGKSPVEDNMVLIVPEDEHGTMQVGQLLGGAVRSENSLMIQNPEWTDDDGNVYQAELPIEKKVPFPFFDVEKALKRLWIVLDQGDLTVLSATNLLKGFPKRWDLPLIDPRRIFRHLEGPRSGGSISNLLSTKLGVLTVLGILGFGSFMSFFLVVVTGHFH